MVAVVGLVLIAVSGIAWTIVYLESIRVGFRQKTYAIPMAALGLNIAWESIYAVHGLVTSVSPQVLINIVWAVADLAIVYTFVRFGRAEFPDFVTRSMFTAWAILVFGASFAVQGLFIAKFGVRDAEVYSAFLQNLFMSGLFIAMFAARRGIRGQTLTIAVAKWLGTLAPTILFGAIGTSTFVLGIGLMCCAFDLVYIGLVGWARTHPDAFVAPANTRPRNDQPLA